MREKRIERFLALADKEPEELSDEEERELSQLAEEMQLRNPVYHAYTLRAWAKGPLQQGSGNPGQAG